eukprot:scaffold233946_cov37-Prasinocladus_malaysianus.AAC.1
MSGKFIVVSLSRYVTTGHIEGLAHLASFKAVLPVVKSLVSRPCCLKRQSNIAFSISGLKIKIMPNYSAGKKERTRTPGSHKASTLKQS